MSSGNGVPSSFTQGDTVVFSYSDPVFPSSAWGLKLAMLKDGRPAALPAGTAQNDGSFLFTLAAADTADLSPGQYVARLVATATNGGARQSLCQFMIFVRPDLTIPLAPTPEMIQLAKMVGVSVGTIQSYGGGGAENWSKFAPAQNRAEIDRLTVIVENQLRELGLSTRGGAKTLVTRFCS